MAIGGKHVVVVALVTLLLTYAAYQGKASPSSHDDSVALAGRKGLSDAQSSETSPVFAEDSVMETESDATEDATVETTEGETSEETSDEATEKTLEDPTEQTSEEASEESTEQISEGSTEQASEQALEDFKEEVSVEVSDEPVVEESWSSEGNAEDVQTEENADFSAENQEASEEAPFEGTQVREMLEGTMSPQGAPAPDISAASAPDMSAASGPSTTIPNPDSSNYPKPQGNPDVYLQEIALNNAFARQNEGFIQSCIKEDGCGTP